MLFFVLGQSFIIADDSHAPTEASLKSKLIDLKQIISGKNNQQEKIPEQKKDCKNDRRKIIKKLIGFGISFGITAALGREFSFGMLEKNQTCPQELTGKHVCQGESIGLILVGLSGARFAQDKLSIETDGLLFAHYLVAGLLRIAYKQYQKRCKDKFTIL